jgi:hypothetical protein
VMGCRGGAAASVLRCWPVNGEERRRSRKLLSVGDLELSLGTVSACLGRFSRNPLSPQGGTWCSELAHDCLPEKETDCVLLELGLQLFLLLAGARLKD